MKLQKIKQLGVSAAMCGCLMVLSNFTYAAAGQTISNKASINFNVASVAQTVVNSAPNGNDVAGANEGTDTTITEDQLVNFAVLTSNTGNIDAVPGAAASSSTHFTTFVIHNVGTGTGNHPEDSTDVVNGSNGKITVALTASVKGAPQPFDTAVNQFAPTNCTIYADTTANTVVSEVALEINGSATVRVSCDIPISAVNEDTSAAIELSGTVTKGYDDAAVANSSNDTAQNKDAVEVVYVDNAAHGVDAVNDNQSVDWSGFTIKSALLNMIKTVSVNNDPINGTTNPKAIPGAILEYIVTVQNNGDEVASNVVITDTMVENLACDSSVASPALSGTATATEGTAKCTEDSDGAKDKAEGACTTIAKDQTCILTFYMKILES